jgi:hypothetical protein
MQIGVWKNAIFWCCLQNTKTVPLNTDITMFDYVPQKTYRDPKQAAPLLAECESCLGVSLLSVTCCLSALLLYSVSGHSSGMSWHSRFICWASIWPDDPVSQYGIFVCISRTHLSNVSTSYQCAIPIKAFQVQPYSSNSASYKIKQNVCLEFRNGFSLLSFRFTVQHY